MERKPRLALVTSAVKLEVASNSLKLTLVVIGLTMKTTTTKYSNYFSVGNFFLNRFKRGIETALTYEWDGFNRSKFWW